MTSSPQTRGARSGWDRSFARFLSPSLIQPAFEGSLACTTAAGMCPLTPCLVGGTNTGFRNTATDKEFDVPLSERRKELKRRRHRRRKLAQYRAKVESATVSEKAHMAQKIRRMTPGAAEIVETFGLEER